MTRNPSKLPRSSSRISVRLPTLISSLLASFNQGGTKTTAAASAEASMDLRCIRITDKVCEGKKLGDLLPAELRVTVRQIRPRNRRDMQPATRETRVRQGDVILAVGPRGELDVVCEYVGGRPTASDFLKFARRDLLSTGLDHLGR
jgi:Trk K+ transport system NAD-binding subunit